MACSGCSGAVERVLSKMAGAPRLAHCRSRCAFAWAAGPALFASPAARRSSAASSSLSLAGRASRSVATPPPSPPHPHPNKRRRVLRRQPGEAAGGGARQGHARGGARDREEDREEDRARQVRSWEFTTRGIWPQRKPRAVDRARADSAVLGSVFTHMPGFGVRRTQAATLLGV
jgi:hypothetical protein